jgi:probable F420-dependent oxidoreductase
MKFWQNLSWLEMDQQVASAKFAEEAGFFGVGHGDHAVFVASVNEGYPYSTDGTPIMRSDWNYPDAWVVMAAQSSVTTTLKFYTGVYVLPLRHPLITAKATGSLAMISNNRAVIGIGSGWQLEEFPVLGVPAERRGARTDDYIEVLHKAWSGKTFEHHSAFVDIPPSRLDPMPGYSPPIYVGGHSPPALRRAAKYGDGWTSAGNTLAETKQIIGEITRLRKEYGRSHLPFDFMAALPRDVESNLDDFKRLRDIGVTSINEYPFQITLKGPSTLDAKKKRMEWFAETIIKPLGT